MDEIVRKRIDSIIREDTGIDPTLVDPDKPISEQVTLDSMQFVGLISRIENAFEIELPVSIIQVTTYREFLGAIDEVMKNGHSL